MNIYPRLSFELSTNEAYIYSFSYIYYRALVTKKIPYGLLKVYKNE